MIVLNLLAGILLAYLGLSAVYLCLYSLLAFLPGSKRDERIAPSKRLARFAVFVPSYKEDAVILSTARHCLQLEYPADKWDLIVVADSLQPETLDQLRATPLILVEVSFEKSTKSRALNKALAQIGEDYDLALIFDADNVTEPEFLHQINQAYQGGYLAIQGHRVAKNLNTPMAVLDAMSEEINNQIFSLGHRAVDLSSRLVGSGMAFEFGMFKSVMATVDAIGGFDKELEMKLLSRGIKVAYLPSALIYDEKVSQSDHFARQRQRWIAAQFHYAKLYFGKAFQALITKGNVDFFDKAIQMILPPRLILPGVLFIGLVLAWLLSPPVWVALWGAAFLANAIGFAMAIPRRLYHPRYLKAFLSLPGAFLKMALSLLKIKGSNKTFIHTPHSATEVTVRK